MTDTYDDWYNSLPTADELGQTFDREDSDRRTRESIDFQRSDAGRAERVRAREEGFVTRTWFGPPRPGVMGTHVVSTARSLEQQQEQELFDRVAAHCDRMTSSLYGISTATHATEQALRGLAFVFDSTERSAAIREAGFKVIDQGST